MPIKAVVCSLVSCGEDKNSVKLLIATSVEDLLPAIIEVNKELLCAKYCDVVSGLRSKVVPIKLVITELFANVSIKVALV